ncbi:helix-turn-helix transcriptional regulator [Streptomyces sp. PAL114]|uniref:helix-turn-helix transcriptional regulator n=1 Tax=Streptomyces sp. PAL114 TaxID=2970893 RepID=UPI0028FD8A75|nr:helix-turn-helix transcriptional regulator [Streptomyces sp. PAL114]MDU0299343.1 helix-turn-helix transcriptional regulator [Streptomyces sp. PAL114]
MDRTSPLGAFLKARRARLSPDDVGLPRYGDRRRVPGLRREEVALLAGVSAGYYTRLEQGQQANASPEVLDALARALHLSPAERDHLHDLSATPGHRTRRPATPGGAEKVSADLRTLLTTMAAQVPALVVGRRNDVLAWNRTGHALLAPHLDFAAPDDPGARPNLSRLVFLDAPTRALYRDWAAKARSVVGNLRILTARNPGDTHLAELVTELSADSSEFAAFWDAHTVAPCGSDVHDLAHPAVGELTVTQQTFDVPKEPHQSFVTFTAEPGSPSATALEALHSHGRTEDAPVACASTP